MNRQGTDLRAMALDLIERRRAGAFGAIDGAAATAVGVYATRMFEIADEIDALAEQGRRLSAREIEGLRRPSRRRLMAWIAMRFGRFA